MKKGARENIVKLVKLKVFTPCFLGLFCSSLPSRRIPPHPAASRRSIVPHPAESRSIQNLLREI